MIIAFHVMISILTLIFCVPESAHHALIICELVIYYRYSS